MRNFSKITLLFFLLFFMGCERVPVPGIGNKHKHELADPNAVYLTPDRFPVHADGLTDDSDIIQAAIDYVEKYHDYGIVFIPTGNYAIHKTLNLWRGIRLIGYGKKRPKLIVNDNTPAFQEKNSYLVQFRGRKPILSQPGNNAPAGIVFSMIRNIDIEIGNGNPGAAGVLFKAGHLSTLQNMDFVLKSGITAVDQTGGLIEGCRFDGGDYALLTDGYAGANPVTLLNCEFTGQQRASISSGVTPLTFIGCTFQQSPYALTIKKGKTESIYIKDCNFVDITIGALLLDQYEHPENAINMINLQCARTPNLLLFRDRNTPVSGNTLYYQIRELTHGMIIDSYENGMVEKNIRTRYRYQPLEEIEAQSFKMPKAPFWKSAVNILDYGAAGDGRIDDTVPFLKAIKDHDLVYLPQGDYLISYPLHLNKATCLTGHHPKTTRIILRDNTPGFNDPDSMQAMLITPPGGKNIITGIGFDPGINAGAVPVKWMAGRKSMLSDTWFDWGGMGDHQLGFQFPFALLVDGGSGLFTNIWCSNVSAAVGVGIRNSSQPGNIIQMTIDNNSHGLVMQDCSNWNVWSLHGKENMGSPYSLMLDIDASTLINWGQLVITREVNGSKDHPYGLQVRGNSSLVIKNMVNQTWDDAPLDHSIFIADRNQLIRDTVMAFITIK